MGGGLAPPLFQDYRRSACVGLRSRIEHSAQAMARSTLSAAHLFSHLPEELTQGLFARSRPVKLAPDQVLFLAGDPGDGCYHVEKGLLKVSVASPAGGERILAILGAGSLIG